MTEKKERVARVRGNLTPNPFPWGKGDNRVWGWHRIFGCGDLEPVPASLREAVRGPSAKRAFARFGQDDGSLMGEVGRRSLRDGRLKRVGELAGDSEPSPPTVVAVGRLSRKITGEVRRSIASPFENTQGRLRSSTPAASAQDDKRIGSGFFASLRMTDRKKMRVRDSRRPNP